MSSNPKSLREALLIAGFCLMMMLAAPATAMSKDVAARNVSTGVVPSVITSPRAPIVVSNEIELTTKKIKFDKDDKLMVLLQEMGINPDADALSLVYALNPNLQNVNSIPPGTELELPKIAKANPGIEKLLKNGQLIALLVDGSMKLDLYSRIESFTRFSTRITPETLRLYEYTSEAQESLLSSLAATSKGLKIIRSGRFPLGSVMMQQLEDSLSNAQELTIQTRDRERQAEVVMEFEYLAQNIMLVALDLESGGDGDITVKVVTKDKEGKEESQLKVYAAGYLNKADKGSPLRGHSSPAEGELPVGDYRMWAVRPGGTEPVTDKPGDKIQVRRGDTKPIPLTIIR